ncbi:hypothetical protein D3C78_1045360 [compost metagenome]
MSEDRLRHIRVTDDIVRAADQLFATETADGYQFIVAVGQVAVQVSGGNQPLLVLEDDFLLGDRQIASHALVSVYAGDQYRCNYPHCMYGDWPYPIN